MSKTPVIWFAQRMVVSSLLLAASFTPAQTRNRIVQNIDNESAGPVAVSGPHSMIRPEFDQGRVPGGMKINMLTMGAGGAGASHKPSAEQVAAMRKMIEAQKKGAQ